MKPGDLVRVKEGCGDGGRMGIIVSVPEDTYPIRRRAQGVQFLRVLFPEGVESINSFWLESVPSDRSGATG